MRLWGMYELYEQLLWLLASTLSWSWPLHDKLWVEVSSLGNHRACSRRICYDHSFHSSDTLQLWTSSCACVSDVVQDVATSSQCEILFEQEQSLIVEFLFCKSSHILLQLDHQNDFSNNCSKQYLKNTLIQISRGTIYQGELTLLGEEKLIKVSMSCHLQLFILIKTNLEHFFNFTHLSLLFDNVKRGRRMYICLCVFLVSLIFRNIMNFQINTSHG